MNLQSFPISLREIEQKIRSAIRCKVCLTAAAHSHSCSILNGASATHSSHWYQAGNRTIEEVTHRKSVFFSLGMGSSRGNRSGLNACGSSHTAGDLYMHAHCQSVCCNRAMMTRCEPQVALFQIESSQSYSQCTVHN
jgi:hypothetical protein